MIRQTSLGIAWTSPLSGCRGIQGIYGGYRVYIRGIQGEYGGYGGIQGIWGNTVKYKGHYIGYNWYDKS